jgi:periplasmic protein TonB
MSRIVLLCAAAVAVLVAACMQRRAETPPSQPEVVPPGPVTKAPESISSVPAPRAARTVAEYKMLVAHRIASASAETFADPLPEVLRSIVVLDISIDRDGMPRQVSVRRSNGIRSLEQRAQESVRRAAPFEAPPWQVLRGSGSVEFLETFLFRDDGKFQIRSLVETPQ